MLLPLMSSTPQLVPFSVLIPALFIVLGVVGIAACLEVNLFLLPKLESTCAFQAKPRSFKHFIGTTLNFFSPHKSLAYLDPKR